MKATQFTGGIETDYTDDNGVLHLDGYTSNEDDSGCVVAYVFNKGVYYTNPEFRYDSLVIDTVNQLKREGIVL